MISSEEHHLITAHCLATGVLSLLSTLPSTDILDEIYGMIEDQQDILRNLMECRHSGSDHLDNLIFHSQQTIENVDKFLKKENVNGQSDA